MIVGVEDARDNPPITVIHRFGQKLRILREAGKLACFNDHRAGLPLTVPENAFTF